jgi:hypothetical protein
MYRTIVVTVSSIPERDAFVKRIYTNLTKEPLRNILIQKEQINKINVYHIENEVQILVRVYFVLIIPVLVNLNQLDDITGDVTFHLDETIETLTKHITKLKSLQGRRIRKGGINEQTFEQLVRCLCETDGQHGAS